MSKEQLEKEFVPYQESLALKKLGFDQPCFKYIYIGSLAINEDLYLEVEPSKAINFNADSLSISQPTFSQAFRFFREEYNLLQNISYVLKKTGGVQWFFDIKGINMTNNNILPHSEIRFEIYEEAELACLRKMIEIVKGGKQ